MCRITTVTLLIVVSVITETQLSEGQQFFKGFDEEIKNCILSFDLEINELLIFAVLKTVVKGIPRAMNISYKHVIC